ncbi:hypothetical protein FQR65_LT19565 [Abscondita terminalis]|nr:hypothetical protein FQR65_LT19565 [Abscondita terminalis]
MCIQENVHTHVNTVIVLLRIIPNWLKHTRRRHKVDHKTGECLPQIAAKEKIPPIATPVQDATSSIDSSDPLMIDFITFSKSDELLIQQGLLNLPSTFDERFILPHQLDLLNGSSNSTGLLNPFVQMQIPNPNSFSQSSCVQFSDLIPSSLI